MNSLHFRKALVFSCVVGLVVGCQGVDEATVASSPNGAVPGLNSFEFKCIPGAGDKEGLGVPSTDAMTLADKTIEREMSYSPPISVSSSSTGGTGEKKYRDVSTISTGYSTISTSKDKLQVVARGNKNDPLDFMVLPKGGLFDKDGNTLSCEKFAAELSDYARQSEATVDDFVLHPNVFPLQDGSKLNVLRFSNKNDVLTPMLGLEDSEFKCFDKPTTDSCKSDLAEAEALGDPAKLALTLYQRFNPPVRKVSKGEKRFYAHIGNIMRTMKRDTIPVSTTVREQKLDAWCDVSLLDTCLANEKSAGCLSFVRKEAGKSICQDKKPEGVAGDGLQKIDFNKTRTCLLAKDLAARGSTANPQLVSSAECLVLLKD